jgi:glycosyltransferase involved in cell wall biosynthesis
MRTLLGISNMHPRDGGPPKVVSGLARALSCRNVDVTIMACSVPAERQAVLDYWQPLRDYGVRLELFPYTGPQSIFYSIELISFVAQNVGNFDVLHNHGVWELSLLGAAQNWRKAGKPYLVSVHGTLDPWSLSQSAWKKKLALSILGTRRYLDDAAGIIFGTEDEREQATPLNLNAPTIIVPNGFDTQDGEKDTAKLRDSLERRFPEILSWRRTILFFSRLHPKKGLDLLVEGFARISADFPDCGILAVAIAQDADYESAIRSRLVELNLQNRVFITTELIGSEARAAMALADIFALPSHQEGFSMALLEAMGAGLPLLVTDACHMNEIEPAGAGIVVAANVDAISAGLGSLLLQTDAQLTVMSKNCLSLSKRYSWASVAEEMIGHYQTALNN